MDWIYLLTFDFHKLAEELDLEIGDVIDFTSSNNVRSYYDNTDALLHLQKLNPPGYLIMPTCCTECFPALEWINNNATKEWSGHAAVTVRKNGRDAYVWHDYKAREGCVGDGVIYLSQFSGSQCNGSQPEGTQHDGSRSDDSEGSWGGKLTSPVLGSSVGYCGAWKSNPQPTRRHGSQPTPATSRGSSTLPFWPRVLDCTSGSLASSARFWLDSAMLETTSPSSEQLAASNAPPSNPYDPRPTVTI